MLKRLILSFLVLALIFPIISSQIIITQQPNSFYNLNDIVKFPIKVVAAQDTFQFLYINLLCNGFETEMHKEYISLLAGEEKAISASLPIMKKYTLVAPAKCKLKVILGQDYLLSNEFDISNLIKINITEKQTEFAPKETVILEGTAFKETGQGINGIFELQFISEGSSINFSNSISNGVFLANFTLPEKIKAGMYLVMLKVYDLDREGNISNYGEINYNIKIKQIPTSLEIILNNQEAIPGSIVEIKPILHDQSGEPIDSSSLVIVTDDQDKTLEQKEVKAGDSISVLIPNGTLPAEWNVLGNSNNLSGEAKIEIIELKQASFLIVNNTLIVKNTGNVPYNDLILVKIGTQPFNINASISVGEEKEFMLTAPQGEYDIEVVATGQEPVNTRVMLTGNAVSIREVTEGAISIASSPITWIFIIIVLAVAAFMIYKKGYRRVFLGRTSDRAMGLRKIEKIIPQGTVLMSAPNNAVVSLSLKGEKQTADIICLRLKNYGQIVQSKQVVQDTMVELSKLADGFNAYVYENGSNIFFILSALKTKTFKNTKTAVQLAQKINSVIEKHNKLFRVPIDYGIGINTGEIVVRDEGNIIKFMPFGDSLNSPKRLSSVANKEIALSDKTNELAREFAKTEKKVSGEASFFAIREMKRDSEENQKFINNFKRKFEKGE